MRHLALLYYVLSFTAGCISIGLCLLIYRQYRKTVLRDYAVFLTALALILFGLILHLYGQLAGLEEFRGFRIAAEAVDRSGALLFLGAAPFFFHRLIAVEVTAVRRAVFLVALGAGCALAVLRPLVPEAAWAFALPLVLMYGMIVFCLVLVAVNLPRIGDPILRRVLRLFFFVSLVFFPVMLVEVLRERLPALRLYDVFELFALPSYFLVINILSVVLCFRTLNQPPYLAGEELTKHFSQSFGITTREREIIPLLIEGRSYAEVADALFISYKTVDNHVQNIYQKTGVRNRLQLANLLQSNRQP